MMKFEKRYKTFKQIAEESKSNDINNKKGAMKSYKFKSGHPGRDYCQLVERKLPVIPIISMTDGNLCDIKMLETGNDDPDKNTQQSRERYAMTAIMMFFPFRHSKHLKADDGSYWQRFVDIGGKNEYNIANNIQEAKEPSFWNKGREILQNVQTRITTEKHMKRPKNKITHVTETPKSTGQRKKENIDEEDNYDMDINDLFADMDMNGESYDSSATEPTPLNDNDLRTHNGLINKANIKEDNIIHTFTKENDVTLLVNSRKEGKSRNKKTSDTETNQQNKNKAPCTYTTKYEDVLTFIQGSMLVGNDDDTDMNDDDGSDTDMHADAETSNSSAPSTQRKIPTLYGIARGKGSRYKLDDKQYIAYLIICTTFLLQLVNEGGCSDTSLGEILGATLNPMAEHVQKTRDQLIKDLKAKGAKEQLVMFLTGAAGCGKSTTMEAAQLYAHKFCTAIAVAFSDYTFYFTATTGSAAALFGGTTIHSGAHLNKTRLTDEMRAIWREDVRILIIDEISFFTTSNIAKLDKQLKKLTGRHDMVYGGVSIVFSGDFHQLKPICAENEVLYSNSTAAAIWENTINCAIFLDNSHRFKDDPLYGQILARMRMGEDTADDRREINKRLIGTHSVTLPENAPDACYACSTNKERNGVTAATYKKHILETHPDISDHTSPPDHTLMIEAIITNRGTWQQTDNNKRRKKRGRKQVSKAVHDTIITQLGDDDIRATDFTSKGAKIEPALRLHPGSHLMCITNDNLDQGRGNGTLCKCLRAKLKRNGQERKWKNWDGKKVWTVSIDSVEWIELEHYPPPHGNKAQTFKLTPQEFSATIKFPLNQDINITLGNATVTQFPVNSNIATTGHKLQGMSKDMIIINSWNYRCTNWVYVVLSRVRTRKGLFLIKPLDEQRQFIVPQELIRFEQRLMEQKERPILDMLGYNQQD